MRRIGKNSQLGVRWFRSRSHWFFFRNSYITTVLYQYWLWDTSSLSWHCRGILSSFWYIIIIHYHHHLCLWHRVWQPVVFVGSLSNCDISAELASGYVYTLWTIKNVTFYFWLTLSNLNWFLQFLYHFNRKDILHAIVVRFTTSP